MQWLRSVRLVLLALLVCLIPASSQAAVLISVGFAPPVLPVYEQPPCPEPGWMWTPGYWAYGPDGYYWVPGTWVPVPEPGLYWTPGYWGWGSGLYSWHPGYWGPTVGYYGGVNYGFGFFGIGFVGGMWRGGIFAYNTAVVHVGVGPGWGGNRVYVDRNVIVSHTVVNNHVAFSGGPGGVNHPPTGEERAAMSQHHFAASSYQTQHETAAMHNVNAYASHNGGHPATAAVARPMAAGTRATPNAGARGYMPAQGARSPNYGATQPRQTTQSRQMTEPRQTTQPRPATEPRQTTQPRPATQPRQTTQSRPAAPPKSEEPRGEPKPKSNEHERDR